MIKKATQSTQQAEEGSSARPGMLTKMPTGTAAGLKRLSPGVYRNASGDLVSSRGKLLRPSRQQRPPMSVPTQQRPQGPREPYDVFAQPVNLSPEERQQMGIDPNDPNLYGRMPDGSLMSTQIGMFPNQPMQNKPGQFTRPNMQNMQSLMQDGFGTPPNYQLAAQQAMRELPQLMAPRPQQAPTYLNMPNRLPPGARPQMDPYAQYMQNEQAQMRPVPMNVGKLGQALSDRMSARDAQQATYNNMAQYRR